MSYENYQGVLKEFEREVMRPSKLNDIGDVYSSPPDFRAVQAICTRCYLSVEAAACLWGIERCIRSRASMFIRYDGRWSVAQCWANLSDSTNHKNNINESRFKKWAAMNNDWSDFYRRTQEFLKLCNLKGLNFSHESLYDVIKMRDKTMKKYEDGSYLQVPKPELFNIAMWIEFSESSKFF
ncbi:TPA_asm: hypothetical protein G0M21_16645 [Salmonella enterica subsp. enterica serovar Typhimurium]|uniref:Uncharacterized protein n=1 Tax=Salmonella typhimurium TaxID=90371 RepID=A0A708TAK6_SALTM|nr:hypothetical protein [Salmonella enterica subsp. enterica serovar Typhimurium]